MIDKEYLDELYECHGDDFLKEIIDLFFEQTPEIVKAIRQAFENQTWEELKQKSHKLKGMALSMSFGPLSLAAEKIEHAAHEQTQDIHHLIQGLETEFQQTENSLQAYTSQRF